MSMHGSPGRPASKIEVPCGRVDPELDHQRDKKVDLMVAKVGTLEEMLRQNTAKASLSEAKDSHCVDGDSQFFRTRYEETASRLRREELAHFQTRSERDAVHKLKDGMDQLFKADIACKTAEVKELSEEKAALTRAKEKLSRDNADLQRRLQDEQEETTESKRADQEKSRELQEQLRRMREENRRNEAEKHDIAYQLEYLQKQMEEMRQDFKRQVEQLKLDEHSKFGEVCSQLQVAQDECDRKAGEVLILEQQKEKQRAQQQQQHMQQLEQQQATFLEERRQNDAAELQRERGSCEQLFRQQLEQQQADLRDQCVKLSVADKENKRLGGVVQDQKVLLWDCESQVRQDRNASKLLAPGEAARILKFREESFACQNAKLHIDLAKRDGLIEDMEQALRDFKTENDRLKQVVTGPSYCPTRSGGGVRCQ